MLKSLPKRTRHAAVDGKVERVRYDDEEIGENNSHVEKAVRDQFKVEHVLHYMDQCAQCQRYFHNEKNGDDDNQHEGGGVGVSTTAKATSCLASCFNANASTGHILVVQQLL